MAVLKVTTANGEIRWEVVMYQEGRGSKRIRRRFERKIDAERFQAKFSQAKIERDENPFLKAASFNRKFGDEAEYWFQDARNRMTESSQIRVQGVLREILPELQTVTLEHFSPEFVSRFQRAQLEKGLKSTTVNRKVNVILAILNNSTRHRRIPFNPSMGFKRLREDLPEMQFWSLEEAGDFLKAMNELYPVGTAQRWAYAAYLTALNTGLRAGELWGLKAIDLQSNGTLLVRRQLARVTGTFEKTKGKKSRVVPCNREVEVELRALIEKGRGQSDEPIFKAPNGGMIDHDNFQKRNFKADLELWGGRKIRFHDLRHTAATLMLASGIDIKTVKEICGHASIVTTMGYAHLVSGSIENVARTFSIAAPTTFALEGESKSQKKEEVETDLRRSSGTFVDR